MWCYDNGLVLGFGAGWVIEGSVFWNRDVKRFGILLGLLIGICYDAFLFTIITISPLLGLNMDLIFLTAITLSYCFAFGIIGFGIYKGLK